MCGRTSRSICVAIVRQVVDGLQTLAHDREVDQRHGAPVGAAVVLGDRDELLRVFENLMENALKYAASGKRRRHCADVRSAQAARRAWRCATTVLASPPSICRG